MEKNLLNYLNGKIKEFKINYLTVLFKDYKAKVNIEIPVMEIKKQRYFNYKHNLKDRVFTVMDASSSSNDDCIFTIDFINKIIILNDLYLNKYFKEYSFVDEFEGCKIFLRKELNEEIDKYINQFELRMAKENLEYLGDVANLNLKKDNLCDISKNYAKYEYITDKSPSIPYIQLVGLTGKSYFKYINMEAHSENFLSTLYIDFISNKDELEKDLFEDVLQVMNLEKLIPDFYLYDIGGYFNFISNKDSYLKTSFFDNIDEYKKIYKCLKEASGVLTINGKEYCPEILNEKYIYDDFTIGTKENSINADLVKVISLNGVQVYKKQ